MIFVFNRICHHNQVYRICMVDLNFLFLHLCGSDIKKCTSLFDWSIRFSPLPISAVSGTGTGELLDLVCSGLKKIEVCMSNSWISNSYRVFVSVLQFDEIGNLLNWAPNFLLSLLILSRVEVLYSSKFDKICTSGHHQVYCKHKHVFW